MLGVGMMFPDEYKKTVDSIKAGKFGEEGKNIMRTVKYAVVDIENSLYFCEKCGNITQAKPMDYYAPKNVDKAAKEEYGIKTVEEWGEVPYWAPYMDFDNNYSLINLKKLILLVINLMVFIELEKKRYSLVKRL